MSVTQKRLLRSFEEKYAAGNLKPNELDGSGLSDVHRAAHEGYLVSLKWLTKHGGSAYGRSTEGCVAAHYASANGHINILQFLLGEAPETLDIKDYNGTTPAYIAAQENRLDCIIWFSKNCRQSIIEAADDGMTALHAAAQEGNHDCVRYMVQTVNCKVLAEDKAGCVPLHFAAAEGHWKVVKWLIEHGGSLGTEQDKTGATPMHLAAECNRVKVIKVLRKLGVPTDVQDENGHTPLDVATERGFQECMNILSQKFPKSSKPFHGIADKGSLKRVRFNETNGSPSTALKNDVDNIFDWDDSHDFNLDLDDEPIKESVTPKKQDIEHIRRQASITRRHDNQIIIPNGGTSISNGVRKTPSPRDEPIIIPPSSNGLQQITPPRDGSHLKAPDIKNGESIASYAQRDAMLRPLLADIIQDLQSAHNARRSVSRTGNHDTWQSKLQMELNNRQHSQAVRSRRQLPRKPSWSMHDAQALLGQNRYSSKGPHPQQQIKVPKDTAVATLPVHRSSSRSTNGHAQHYSVPMTKVSRPNPRHGPPEGKEFERYHRYYANGNAGVLDPSNVLRSVPMSSIDPRDQNRAEEDPNMEERIAAYSYNLAPRRNKGSVRWNSFVTGVSSFFNSLKTKRKTKDYEESLWWTGTKGLYMPNEGSREVINSLPVMRHTAMNGFDEDDHLKTGNNRPHSVSFPRNKREAPGRPNGTKNTKEFKQIKDLALDNTLRGKQKSKGTRVNNNSTPQESLESLVTQKGQKGVDVRSLRINKKGTVRERGNALIW